METSPNVELEAAKILQKLIHESKDEPTKLATKLYVILQHMRTSGKENSMPFQVISRAMESVIKQNNLDIETLMSSRLTLAAGTQMGDSTSSQLAGGAVKVHGVSHDIPGSYQSTESANQTHYGSSFDTLGFGPKMSKDRGMEELHPMPLGDHSAGNSIAGKTLDHGGSSTAAIVNKGCIPSSVPNTNMLRTVPPRDPGNFPISQSSNDGMPFKEQQLKQLRAQCLVFLAFRNGLMPKKLHLEIALGNIYTKEDVPRRDLIDQKGNEQFVHGPSSIPKNLIGLRTEAG